MLAATRCEGPQVRRPTEYPAVMTDADPLGWIGSTLESKYRIESLVGEGGFGWVYRGHHVAFGKPIAIKFLKAGLATPGAKRDRMLQKFLEEGRMLHDLSRATAGVVQALDIGAAVSPRGEWTLYIVMEWIDGGTLTEDLKQHPRRSVAQAIALLDPALDALAAAHELGIAHRDLKPSNLMLARIGNRQTVKVVDFGIAKVMGDVREPSAAFTNPGDPRMFSIAYAAPEQFEPTVGATGPWTDVYALALILVQLVDGTRPYGSEGFAESRAQALDLERRPMLASDRSLDAVLRRALAVDPRNRYASAGELRDALHAAIAPPSARRPSRKVTEGAAPESAPRMPKWPFVGLILGAAVGIAYFVGRDALRPPVVADAGIAIPDAVAVPSPDEAAREVFLRWDAAEQRKNPADIVAMYADPGCYFHYKATSGERRATLAKAYLADPTLSQSATVGSLRIQRLPSGNIRLDFDKIFTAGGKPDPEPTHGYLVLNASMKIIAEGDSRTDGKMKDAGETGTCKNWGSW